MGGGINSGCAVNWQNPVLSTDGCGVAGACPPLPRQLHVCPPAQTRTPCNFRLPARSAAPYARQLLLEGNSLQDAQLAKMKQQFLKGAKLQVGGWALAAICWLLGAGWAGAAAAAAAAALPLTPPLPPASPPPPVPPPFSCRTAR